MKNQEFCYWLQGYFEIGKHTLLNRQKVLAIDAMLKQIHEPLGEFTSWLRSVIDLFAMENFYQDLVDYFTPQICWRLDLIFAHVIDNSYETDLHPSVSKKIHDGTYDER